MSDDDFIRNPVNERQAAAQLRQIAAFIDAKTHRMRVGPSRNDIAKHFGVTTGTVDVWSRRLVAAGYLDTDARAQGRGLVLTTSGALRTKPLPVKKPISLVGARRRYRPRKDTTE